MNKLKPKSLIYYDFYEMNDIVKKELGYDLRNCGKYFYPNQDKTPYLDFWHWQLDNCFDRLSNDTYCHLYIGLDFDTITVWQMEIQKTWNWLFRDIADEGGHVWVWVSW